MSFGLFSAFILWMTASPSEQQPTEAKPPFYAEEDVQTFRTHHGILANPPKYARKVRWHCLIADPTCGFGVELNAMGAYAFRLRQGVVAGENVVYRWHSGRSQYDVWVNIPTLIETSGKLKFTRISLGPKGGVIVSDGGSLWGNFGIAMRYWFGRSRFSPALELSGGFSFKIIEENRDRKLISQRSPIGFTADIGLGIGGFGALVFGGQFDSPSAREELPNSERIYPSGMVFVGFRGNILWGAPAAIAVTNHALSQRYVKTP